MRLPPRSLVVLVGPSGAGKSYWAADNFRPEQIVSSDALRAVVGTATHDQRASADAFAVLDLIVERRLRRGLLTVIDTLGLDDERRAEWRRLARRHDMACHAVMWDTPADVCRARNKTRAVPVPAKVLAGQLTARDRVAGIIGGEGFDEVHAPSSVEIAVFAPGNRTATRLRFGLQLSSFPNGLSSLRETLAVAESVGFSSIWVMDHLMQIPQVGREWEDLPESWTALGWIAANTQAARIGTLVSAITMRHPAHLAKIVATLDVLSGGRVVCGLGAAWWAQEHERYAIPFPPLADRYALLEDALELLPLMWGPGSPAFSGRIINVSEATCYPRPIQEHVPLLVGGSGEKRTLKIAARHADACNLFGDAPTVGHKVDVLRGHAADAGRPTPKVTHLSTAVAARSRRELAAALDRLGGGAPPEAALQRLGAGTVDDQVGRYEGLAEAGVETAIVALPDVATPGALEAFGAVIEAFPSPGPGW